MAGRIVAVVAAGASMVVLAVGSAVAAPRHTAGLWSREAVRYFVTPKPGNLVIGHAVVNGWMHEQGATQFNLRVDCSRAKRRLRRGADGKLRRVRQHYTAYVDGATARAVFNVRLHVPAWHSSRVWTPGRCVGDFMVWNGAQPSPTNDPEFVVSIRFVKR